MGFLTNKHVIIAMLVAPILAVVAYFAVDYQVSEKPHAAKAGDSYVLVAKSNCRYESGKCTLKNGDIEIKVTTDKLESNQLQFSVNSELPMSGVKLGFTQEGEVPSIMPEMKPVDNNLMAWQALVNKQAIQDLAMQIVVKIDDTIYYGQTGTLFIQKKTAYQ